MTLVEKVQQFRPVRAFMHYSERKGPIIAQGMTLSAFFSLFAALFVAFAVFMQVLGGNAALREQVIDSIARSVPGLINQGSGGAIDVDALTNSSIIGIAGIIASLSIIVTAINWLGISREGFRAMFDLPNPQPNAVLLKLGDFGLAVAIGLLVVASAAAVTITSALAKELGLSGVSQVLTIFAGLVLDTLIVLLLFRVGGRLRLPWQRLLGAAFACSVAFQVLKFFASMLLGGVERNPLLASVATVVGILIWLGFVNQILLISLAFLAVGNVGAGYSRLEQVDAAERVRAAEAKKAFEENREGFLEEVRGQLDDDRSKAVKKLQKKLRKH